MAKWHCFEIQMIEKNFVQRALNLATVAGGEKVFWQIYVFENDTVIKVTNAADLGTHCKNLKL